MRNQPGPLAPPAPLRTPFRSGDASECEELKGHCREQRVSLTACRGDMAARVEEDCLLWSRNGMGFSVISSGLVAQMSQCLSPVSPCADPELQHQCGMGEGRVSSGLRGSPGAPFTSLHSPCTHRAQDNTNQRTKAVIRVWSLG